MIRRIPGRAAAAAALLAVFASGVLALAAPAVAAPYPPTNPASLSASAYDPCAGASNIIGGNGFQPGETVRLVLANTGEIGRPVVGADGSFQTTVTIPLEARGSDQVLATGLSSGLSAGLTLEIPCVLGQSATRIDGSGNGGGLAYTGAAVGGALLAGAVLIGGGGALVVAGRRRRGVGAAG